MKTLSKLSFILLISISLFGCDSNIGMDKYYFPYKVIAITNISSKTYCKYYLNTSHSYYEFIDEIVIVDSIGKFNIGDSILLSAYKCNNQK